jgi:hypothetical protein
MLTNDNPLPTMRDDIDTFRCDDCSGPGPPAMGADAVATLSPPCRPPEA